MWLTPRLKVKVTFAEIAAGRLRVHDGVRRGSSF
jgi:hypothetical protein